MVRFIVALLALLASDPAMAQHQTFRDANGRTLGRSTTDARGNTTYYDSMGRNTGRSVTRLQRQHHPLRQLRSSTGPSKGASDGLALVGIRKPAALTVGWFDPHRADYEARWRGFCERAVRTRPDLQTAWAGRIQGVTNTLEAVIFRDDGYPWSPWGPLDQLPR